MAKTKVIRGFSMKDQIELVLHNAIGLPIWSIGRGADLEWFAIGVERKEVHLEKGGSKVVSEFALHVQCAWRIVGPEGIIVASRDRYYPAGVDPYKDLEEFDWDIPGANRCDERVARLLELRQDRPLTILSVKSDNVGSVYFTLADEFSLEIFPDSSVLSEYWRFFRPNSDELHFVVGSKGIERE
jgi:hypothetical protein